MQTSNSIAAIAIYVLGGLAVDTMNGTLPVFVANYNTLIVAHLFDMVIKKFTIDGQPSDRLCALKLVLFNQN